MKILKIHTLEKGWHDRDEVLLYAAFQILVDFVEQEHPDKLINWNDTEEHRRVWKEMRSLYRWWTKTRPARHSPLNDKQLAVPPLRFRKTPDSEMYDVVEPDRKNTRPTIGRSKSTGSWNRSGTRKISATCTG